MHLSKLAFSRFLVCLLISLLLISCGNPEPDIHHHGSAHDQHGHDQTSATKYDHQENGYDHQENGISNMHVNKPDECHLCGMVIQPFAGPKGLLEEKNSGQVRKFCSTNDLFSYALQPENLHTIHKIYVHDMSEVEWSSPQDSKMLDASKAWYVAEHDLQGAMGPTIASFKTEMAAHHFQSEHGGYLLTYAEINLELMTKLMQMPMHH